MVSKRIPLQRGVIVVLAALVLVATSVTGVATATAQDGGIEHTLTLEPAPCPGVLTEITVEAGTLVYLCGAVTNNTGETIDFHAWTTSAEAAGASATPRDFFNLRREVAPGETITNNDFGEGTGVKSFNAETIVVTSTWTARTASGAELSDTATAAITFVVPDARCRGLIATTVGTPGDDWGLVGTPGDDVIAGLGGDDFIVGNGGNDVICGHEGDDLIAAWLGSDVVYGGPGNDRILGGTGLALPEAPPDGDDVLIGGPGDDELEGGAGADRLLGGSGSDSLDGDGGDDVVIGGGDADKAAGAGGDDTVRGGDGDDNLLGGTGDDSLGGQAGDDRMRGGPDVDGCFGGAGTDRAAACERTARVP